MGSIPEIGCALLIILVGAILGVVDIALARECWTLRDDLSHAMCMSAKSHYTFCGNDSARR